MPPLRVAVDATSLYGPRTGIGRFTEAVLAELGRDPELDLRAFAITWRGHGDLASLLPPGVTAVSARMAARPLRALWRRVDHPRIEHWTGAIDLVHGANFVVPPARATRVVSVHDLTFLHYPEFCTDDVLQYPRLLHRAIASGAWVHTDSEFVRQEVVDLLGADPDRVVAVPLGITAPPQGDPARGRQLAGSDAFVLALGTVEPRKNLPALVEAFDLLASSRRELRLVVAGADGWGLGAYETAVQASTHGDRITRLGYVTESARGDLLAAASVLAVPSHYEGFGLSAAEAMAAGVPVVAANGGSHPEVVGEAGLLVDASDVGELAAAIDSILGDEELARRLRSSGRARASTLTWDRTAAGLVALWRRAVGAEVAPR